MAQRHAVRRGHRGCDHHRTEGNYDNAGILQPNNADTIAISRMDSDGLNSTPLVSVTEVDVYKETVSAGVFSDATGCAAGTCENRYTATGSLHRVRSSGIPAVPNVGPRRLREVGHPLLVHPVDPDDTFNSTTVNLFRLEPQQ